MNALMVLITVLLVISALFLVISIVLNKMLVAFVSFLGIVILAPAFVILSDKQSEEIDSKIQACVDKGGFPIVSGDSVKCFVASTTTGS